MDLSTATQQFEADVIRLINASRLHPTVVRLVLVNLNNALLDKEREMAKQAEEESKHG